MRVRVSKWGNSLGLRLPRALARQIGVQEGRQVEVSAQGSRLIIEACPDYSLAALLANMTPEAMHEAFDWGQDLGGEVVEN